jgi:hypothetical protein
MLPTVIENLLRKNDDKMTFQLTKKQSSIILTSLNLIRFEIVSKSDHKEAKDTLDIMRELIVLFDSRLKH